MNYKNIAYAKLNLDFDHEQFSQEYDQKILPHSCYVGNGFTSRYLTRKLNQTWNMVDPATYNKGGGLQVYGHLDHLGAPQWKMTQLMYLVTHDNDPDNLKQSSHRGGIALRNANLDREWQVKPEFEQLEIVKFINTLPLTKIVSMHCVSIEAGNYANIHRDGKYATEGDDPDSATVENGVFNQGYVVISLNISDGGSPLYWSLDGEETKNVRTVNDSAYIISDYFLHGVSVCTSRRRQVRVTGIPSIGLAKLIDQNYKVELGEDYVFDAKENWYPG